jgi:pyruvate formate lyase activating enzyme
MNVLGRIHSVDSLTALDGPGVRYMIFLQGCMLRCKCCSNPDTWDKRKGNLVDSDTVVNNIKKYKSYIEGITISGGEPLVQPKFVSSIFQRTKELNLTTCIDTAGQSGIKSWDMVLPHTDMALVCLKHIDPIKYKEFTGTPQIQALKFIERLNQMNIPFNLRYLLIPKYSDNEEDIDKFIEYAKQQPLLKSIELLPYHKLGVNKWKEMGLEYTLEDISPPSKEKIQHVKEGIQRAGLKVI